MGICLRRVQTCIWSSWWHCQSLFLASIKSRLVLPFWYRLTRVVPVKGLLNGCCCCLLPFICGFYCLHERLVCFLSLSYCAYDALKMVKVMIKLVDVVERHRRVQSQENVQKFTDSGLSLFLVKTLISFLCSAYSLLVLMLMRPQRWPCHVLLLVHGQVTIIIVVSVCLFVCLFVQSFSEPSLIRFRSN